MTVALKGSLTCESVEVRVSSSRMRRATSCGMVRACAVTSVGMAASVIVTRRTAILARRDVRRFNGDVLSVSGSRALGDWRNRLLSGRASQQRRV